MVLGRLLGWEVAGNSWRPLPEFLLEAGPDAPLVCELSSFQLWYLREHQPRFTAAILTLLAVDHLDWHPDIAHYRTAKLSLLDWADAVASAPSARLPGGLPAVTCTDGVFRSADGHILAQRSDLPPPGAHNADNACLALAVALHLGVPPAAIPARLRSAEPLPHRLREVHRAGSLSFIDDSIATTPEAAIAGIASFSGPVAVILGGSDKGADFTALATVVRERQTKVVLLGATAPRLAAAGIEAPIAADLDAAVRLAATAIGNHGTVLLSPGCASFDLFRGFDHRGDCFAETARRLFPTA